MCDGRIILSHLIFILSHPIPRQRILESPLEKKAGKNYGPPGSKKLIYFVDDMNMAALDKYNTQPCVSLMRQHMGYGHIYDLSKLQTKVTSFVTSFVTPLFMHLILCRC